MISSATSPIESHLSMPTVHVLSAEYTNRWTAFVANHPDANLYHTLVWRDLIQDVFGHKPLYLIGLRQREVCAVLPLFEVRFPLLGSKLVSIPYDIGSGGALAVDEVAERGIVERAIAIARDQRVDYLELRCGERRDACERLGLQSSEPVLISEMHLNAGDDVWANVSADHRKAVRKAEKRGVTIRGAVNVDDFRSFYQVQLRVFRDFGTPPYGSNYFPGVWQRLHDAGNVQLLLAEMDRRCVGGLLLFAWKRNWVSKFAACLPEAVSSRAYAALYWRAIQLALEQGCRNLSWGTSTRAQTGLIDFKRRWGASTRPAVVYDLPVQGKPPALESYYDGDGLTRRLWRRMPIAATSVLGGYLSRWYC